MRVSDDALDRLEQRLGVLLTVGITLSAVALAAGLSLWLVRPEDAVVSWLMKIGLFTLMATPILRVAVSLAGYVRMRDWFFVATTIAVFIELTFTVVTALSR
jgi:uncharacterized membrane protein